MIDEELARIAALKQTGDHVEAHVRAVELARTHAGDARAQLAAAYACDRLDLEHDAIAYYERARILGVPLEDQPRFLVGFGSTLRNVGRVEESVAVLTEATRAHPDKAELLAFLALAQHSAGRADLALATMLDAALRAARIDGFGPYTRALGEYQAALAAAAADAPPK